MRAGQLTRYIDIQQRSMTRDTFGQQVETWTDIKYVWGYIEALSGSDRAAGQAYSTDVSHRITVRYDDIFDDPRVAATYRAVYNNRYFHIEAVMNVDESNRTIQLMCSEGLNYG
jgi:SPP1 family predicted phage head-tail adaptor